MVEFKLRRTQGKTWATARSEDFVTPKFLDEIGKLLVSAVVFEARKDLAKQGNAPTPRGVAEGIPKSDRFFDSFFFRVEGQSVALYSSWPQIEQITEGRRKYPLTWSTKEKGVDRVPIKGPGGTVLLRTTPRTTQQAWIHPGFRKHNFLRRGYERARRQMDRKFSEQVARILRKMPVV